jgi:hypothetical protein
VPRLTGAGPGPRLASLSAAYPQRRFLLALMPAQRPPPRFGVEGGGGRDGRATISAARRPYYPSKLTMVARFSNWCASAVQLREMSKSTADRRAEFAGSSPRVL